MIELLVENFKVRENCLEIWLTVEVTVEATVDVTVEVTVAFRLSDIFSLR